jgi:hypothetical protein
MKSIDTTNIAGAAKAPFIKVTHDHYKASIKETGGNIIVGLTNYTTNDVIILWGCTVTANIGGTSTVTEGAIFYNNEIYNVEANASISSPANTLVWNIVDSYEASDSTLQWSDGNIRDLHMDSKFVLSNAVSGSGIADYNAATVRPIYSTYRTAGGVEFQLPKLREKVLLIGDWDMDTDATKILPHGIADYTKIRTVFASIINDLSTTVSPLANFDVASWVADGQVLNIDTTNVNLVRRTGGFYDGGGFNSTSFNRGFVTIQYES